MRNSTPTTLLALLFVGAAAAHPNLAGPWQVANPPAALKTDQGTTPPLLPAARAVYDRYLAQAAKGDHSYDPIARCLPPGVPRLALQPMPFKIEAGHRTVAIVYQWNHLYRLAYLDQPHFTQIAPQYLGQSAATWQGDSLVIDSNQFDGSTLLDDSGLPHSASLHVIERYSLGKTANLLQLQLTIDDPATYAHSWTATVMFQKRPGTIIAEDYCLRRTGSLSRRPSE